MKNSWKKTAAFVLAFTLVAAPLTQTAGKGGLFGGSAITAKAAEYSEGDDASIFSISVGDTFDVGSTITRNNSAGVLQEIYVDDYLVFKYYGPGTYTVNENLTLTAVDGVKYYFDSTDTNDLTNATVTVDVAAKSTTVKIGDKNVGPAKYDVKYGSTLENATADFPTQAGSYYAFVTAKETAGNYIGQAKSEAFTVSAEGAVTWTDISANKSQDGISITSSGVDFMGNYIYGYNGSITFTSTAGKIKKIEISCNGHNMNVFGNISSGWKECWGDGPLVWNGTAADSVTLSARTIDIMDFSQAVFTLEAKSDISDTTVTVDTENQAVSVTRGNAFIPEDEYEVTYGTTAETATTDFPTASGKYYAFVTAKTESENYTGTAKSEAFTVVNTITLNSENVTIADFTYDGTEKTPVLQYGDTALVKDTDYELLTTEGDTASATNAGTYTIHINGKGDYAGETIALTWKINKADVTVTADAISKTYGEDDPVLTYTAGALFGTDAFTGALARAEGEAVNTYAITQGTLSAGDNYNITFTGADFTIAKIPFTLTGASLTYNGDAQNLISGDVPAGTLFTLTPPQEPDYETEKTKISGWISALNDKANNASSSEEGDYYYSAASALSYYYSVLNYLNRNYESNPVNVMSEAVRSAGEMAQGVTPSDDVKEAIDYINTYIKDKTLDDVKARFATVEPDDWSDTITATNAGTYTVYYKGSGNYDDTVKSVTATIKQAVPAVLIPANLPAEYGQTLADVELPTDENGTWAWDDALTTSVGDVGNNTFSATFTPYDTDNYNTYTTDLTVAVTAISATPTAVGTLNATYGQTLADVALPTAEDGRWAWKDAGTTSVGNAGEQTFKAVFTPSSPNYTAIEQDVTINVAKADPTPDAVTGLTIAYGKKLSDVTLPTGSTWDDDPLSVGNVGDNAFAATYTPADTDNYNVLKQNLTVNVVAVDKAALNEAVTAANTYLATIQKTVYADPALALSFAITDAKGVAENDNVTEEQVAQAITNVNNAVTTAKAAVKDIDDTLAAQAVTDQINALPAAADIVSADKTAVDAAREAYTNLTEAQKAKVTTETTDKLTAAEKAVADRIAADAVIAKIDEIGTVALTDESKALIDEARAVYDTLTDDQKALVSNYAALTAGEQDFSELQVDDVTTKIDAIGDIELTDESKAAIDAAREAYNALSADQQALVANAKVLDYAEKLYEALEDKKTAEDEKAAAEAAKAQAEADAAKAVADAQAAQKAAEDAQAAAEKSAQEAADKAAAAETAKKAAEDALAKGEADAAEKVAAAEAAQKAAEDAQAKAEAEAAAAKTAQEKAETAQKAAEDALAKAESDAAAKIAAAQAAQKAAEDAQAAAEKSAQEAADKAAAAETAKKAAEDALAKGEADAAEKVAAAEAAQKAAEDAQAKAEAEAAAAKTAQENAEKAKEAAETALANAEKDAAAKVAAAQAAQKTAETAQATAEQTAKEATEKAAAAEKAQATAEQTAKEATEKAAAAEEAQKVAEAAQAEAEKKAAEDKAAADKDAAAKVVALINAVGKVKKTNDCENKIVSARAAYEALTDDQKAYVTNFATLVKAESDYNTLPQTGMSGFHKVLAGMAALMGITGMGLVKKSRKEDEEE